jgi:hypothetical protein
MANDDSSNPVLSDVTFSGNTTQSTTIYPPSGGGMFNTNSNPNLTNVTFSNNSAEYGGGIFNNVSSSPVLVNVTFSNNTAIYDGGGMVSRDVNSRPSLQNVTLAGNSASHAGGAIADAGGLIMRNSIIWSNTGGSLIVVGPGTPDITYSIVEGDMLAMEIWMRILC